MNKANQIIAIVILSIVLVVIGSMAGIPKTQKPEPYMPPVPSNEKPITTPTPTPKQTPPKAGVVTLTGVGLCLPHRDTTGAQTAECAIGFQAEDGNNYGLADTDPTYKNIMSVGPGDRFQIHGTFIPKEDAKYDSVGVVMVDSVRLIK